MPLASADASTAASITVTLPVYSSSCPKYLRTVAPAWMIVFFVLGFVVALAALCFAASNAPSSITTWSAPSEALFVASDEVTVFALLGAEAATAAALTVSPLHSL